jgi:hypothetical protein
MCVVAYWRGEGGGGGSCSSRREPSVNGKVERRFSGPARRLRCVGNPFAEWIYGSELICESTRLMPNRTNNAQE